MTKPLDDLRKRAFQILETNKYEKSSEIRNDFEKLLEEFNIHKIELELQQEELLSANFKLEKQNQRLEELFEQAPVPYFVLDRQGYIDQLNKAAVQMLGIDKIKVLQTPFTRYIHPACQDDFYFYWQKITENTDPQSLEIQLNVEEDKAKYYLLSSMTFREVPGGPLYFRISAIDISESKETEKMLTIAKQKAEEASLSKSEFLANISHEIRTPLNAILGFTEILKDYPVTDEKFSNYLTGIEKSSKALMGLINDILDLSRLEAGKMSISPGIVDIRSLVEDVRQIFSVKAAHKSIELNIKIKEKLPQLLKVDGIRLKQILFNLVGNAVKFTEKGSIDIMLSCCDSKAKTGFVDLTITVKDTGIGISPHYVESIFEPFFQKYPPGLGRQEGTGLGLSISRRLVEMMNGRISVKSEPGSGTRFTVFITSVEFVSFEVGKFTGKAKKAPKSVIPVRKMAKPEEEDMSKQLRNEMLNILGSENALKNFMSLPAWSEYEKIADIQGFEEVADFATGISDIAAKYNLPLLYLLAENLHREASELNVIEINKILGTLGTLRRE